MGSYEDKMNKPVMVVEKSILFKEKKINDFSIHKDYNFEQIILKHNHFIRRGDAEVNFNLCQPIPWIIVIDESDNTVFIYQRPTDKNKHTETRLHGKWTFGVGGHVDPEDKLGNPLHTNLFREAKEEIGIDLKEVPSVIGYIYCEKTEVDKVHIGIVYAIKIKSKNQLMVDKDEMADYKFLKFNELKEFIKTEGVILESWAEIALPLIEGYLEKM